MAAKTLIRVDAWRCPTCSRSFTRSNQRHACGTTDGKDGLRNRPESVAHTFTSLIKFANSLGAIEVVSRDRYVLLRTLRIFADLVVMKDCIRLAIHLKRKVEDPRFIKVIADHRQVTHVIKLYSEADVDSVQTYLAEAYSSSRS